MLLLNTNILLLQIDIGCICEDVLFAKISPPEMLLVSEVAAFACAPATETWIMFVLIFWLANASRNIVKIHKNTFSRCFISRAVVHLTFINIFLIRQFLIDHDLP